MLDNTSIFRGIWGQQGTIRAARLVFGSDSTSGRKEEPHWLGQRSKPIRQQGKNHPAVVTCLGPAESKSSLFFFSRTSSGASPCWSVV